MTIPGTTSEAERRLAERGLTIEEYDEFYRDSQPASVGFIGLLPDEAGTYGVAYLAPDTGSATRERFARWAEQKVDNYLECGPMRDGWEQRQSDGGWQLWARDEDLAGFAAD